MAGGSRCGIGTTVEKVLEVTRTSIGTQNVKPDKILLSISPAVLSIMRYSPSVIMTLIMISMAEGWQKR